MKGIEKQLMKEKYSINKTKMQKTIIKQKFYNQFYLLNGHSKKRGLQGNKQTLAGESNPDFLYEDYAVRTLECNPEWPICLYDFTFKQTYHHTHVYKEADIFVTKLIENHIEDPSESEEI